MPPAILRGCLLAVTALVLLVPAWLSPGTFNPRHLWQATSILLTLGWLLGLATSRHGLKAGLLPPLALGAGWLFLRSRFLLPSVPGPEDLPVVLIIISFWRDTGPVAPLACDLAVFLLPWSWFHLSGGLPSAFSDILLLGAGATLCLIRPRFSVSRRLLALPAALLLALTLLGRVGWDGTPKAGRVLFEESHASWESARRSSAGRSLPGKDAATGHGDLATLLGYWGFSVEFLDAWEPDRLCGSDILVLPFPTKPYSQSEISDILRFVSAGGGLLAIGEHTNMEGVLESLNPVLSPMGLSLGFDTVWLPDAHRYFLAHAAHPMTLAATHLNVANGASVQAKGLSTFALLSARWGVFADEGDVHNTSRSLLGDSHFQPDRETSRDILLAAGARFGQGRVLLLGDSTYFQNGGIFDAPDTARATFHWLNHRETLPLDPVPLRWTTLALLFLVAVGCLATGFHPTTFIRFAAAAILFVQLAATLSLSPAYQGGGRLSLPNQVIVDQAHAESLALYHRRRDAPGAVLDTLVGTVQAAGRVPRIHFSGPLDAITAEPVAGVLLPAPRTPFDAAELAWLNRVVSAGAVCLLIVDPLYPEGSRAILDTLHLAVGALPVAARTPLASSGVVYQVPDGPLVPNLASDPLFDGASGFRLQRPFEILPAGADLRSTVSSPRGTARFHDSIHPLATYEGGVVLARIDCGKGLYIVMADPLLAQASSFERADGVTDPDRWRFFVNVFKRGIALPTERVP